MSEVTPLINGAVTLEATSGLGTRAARPARTVWQEGTLQVFEEPSLAITSLRRSRVRADETWLPRRLKEFGLSMPEEPNALCGAAQLSCARIEPHAWLLIGGAVGLNAAGKGWLPTDISARLTAFRLVGVQASDLLAGGARMSGMSPGVCRWLPFAEVFQVMIQQFAAAEYRLLVDVSYAAFLADWLADSASNVAPLGGCAMSRNH